MVAAFPTEAVDDRGLGRISAGRRPRSVLSRPTRRGNIAILALLTLLGEGAVLPSLERTVVAAAIAAGIALASKLGQLSQKVAYSPA
jgi:hypothetical protein